MKTPTARCALFAVFMLAACAPVRWEHPALGAAQSEADLEDCRRQAWIEAQREAFFYYRPYPYRGRDGRFYWRYYDPYWYGAGDRFFRETQLRDFCMRSKGYNLVPVEPAQ